MRELQNLLGRAVLRAWKGGERDETVILGPEHLGDLSQEEPRLVSKGPVMTPPFAVPVDNTLHEAVEDYKRSLIAAAVSASKNNWSAAARSLGLHRSNLYHMAKRLGLVTGQSDTERSD